MTKTVFKEIAIILLLLIVVILLLGILLYDYIPNSVTVPAKVQAYEMPEEMKEELEETLAQDSQNIIKTYYIDSTALNIYENNDSYDKGKQDPFTSYNTSNTQSTSSSGTSNGSNSSSSNNSETSSNSNSSSSTGVYFNTPGKN